MKCPYCGSDTGSGDEGECPGCGNVLRKSDPPQELSGSADKTVVTSDTGIRLRNEAKALLANGEKEKAIIKSRAALYLPFCSATVLCEIGAMLSKMNLPYDALNAYRKALAIEPDNPGILFKTATLLGQRKSYADATKLLERLLKIDPKNPQARLMLKIIEDRMKSESDETYEAQLKQREEKTASGIERIYQLVKEADSSTWWGGSLWVIFPFLFFIVKVWVGDDETVTKYLLTALFLYTILLGVVLHELGHGMTAWLLGDSTAYRAGRLTLNPVRHVSMIGTFITPVVVYSLVGFMFGWARPVPFNPINLPKHPRDQVLVAGAGPAMSLTVSYIMFTLFLIAASWHNSVYPEHAVRFSIDLAGPISVGGGAFSGPFWYVLLEIFALGAVVNLVLAVFNLIPLPPLDGGWLLRAIVRPTFAVKLWRYQWVSIVVIIFTLYTGVIAYIFYPAYVAMAGYFFLSELIL